MSDSKQFTLTQKTWTANKVQITETMLQMAAVYVAEPTEFHMAMICHDSEFFRPFYDASEELREYDEENGNEDDEAILMASLWIYALANADAPAQYIEIIKRLVTIQVDGL
jgi:hypothetical protein